MRHKPVCGAIFLISQCTRAADFSNRGFAALVAAMRQNTHSRKRVDSSYRRSPSLRLTALQYSINSQASRSEGPARIFISYQRDPSSGWAAHFASELDRKHHIAAFVDTQRMDSAVRFPARLRKAIQECDVFVCLLSGSTLQSKWVQEEIRLAWENNKPMVPVFQESYSQPDPSERLEPHIEALINYEGVKLFDRQNVYVEDAIERLARMVTESVKKSVRSPAE